MVVKVHCLASEKDKLPDNVKVPDDIKTSETGAAPEGDKKTEETTTEAQKTLIRKENLKHEL